MNGKRGIRLVLISAALLTGLVGQLPEAAAAKKKKRVERVAEAAYVGAFGGVAADCLGDSLGCVVFPVERGERFVSLEIADGSGQPVWASVYVYGYSSGADAHEHICGSSERPLALAGGVEELVITLTQDPGGVQNSCSGVATAGDVTATFSNIP